MTLKGNLIVGASSFPGNPYDGHTMHEQIEQSAILMQGLGVKPEVVYADLGYRGVDKDNPAIEIKHRGKDKRLTDEERRLVKRRQAIEPIIGHIKADHRMDRCHLKGSEGDAMHPVLCSAGYNIRWLLRMIVKKGLGLLLCLLQASGLSGMLKKLAAIDRKTQISAGCWLEMNFAGATTYVIWCRALEPSMAVTASGTVEKYGMKIQELS